MLRFLQKVLRFLQKAQQILRFPQRRTGYMAHTLIAHARKHVSRLAKQSTMNQRQAFEAFCKERYGGFDEEDNEEEEAIPSCKRSKTVTRRKGARILAMIKNRSAADSGTHSAKFQHWVKHCGFQIVSYTLLGIHDVLCLPAKRPVSC